MLMTALQPAGDGGKCTWFLCFTPPTEHFRLRWIRPTCDFSCYSIKFHLLMPYVICVLTNEPFLAQKVLNEFIWNNFHPNVAKHLANKVLKCALGSCMWWQCVGIEIIRSAGWGRRTENYRAGTQLIAWEALAKRWLHFLSFPASSFCLLPPLPFPLGNPACLESIKGEHQIRQGIIS